MKRNFLILFAAITLLFAVSASAQSLSDLGNIGSGSTGSGSSGSGSSGSGGGSTSTGSSSGTSYEQTSLESTADTPSFQGFQELGSGSFVGRPSSGSPFIGREQSFDGSRTPSNRQVSSASTTRRTSSSRTGSSRTSAGRTSSTGSNANAVRAATTTDFAFSPMEVAQREASFRTRINRLPNLRGVPNEVRVKLDFSKPETVATVEGNVSSERDRKLIRQLLLLEPGIDRVDNRLVVRAGSKTESLPTLDPAVESPAPTKRTAPILAPTVD